MRIFSVLLATALTTMLVVAPSSAAAPETTPELCDFPRQPARSASGQIAGVVCEHGTGESGMEPTVSVNSRGTLFLGMATDRGVFDQTEGIATGTARTDLLRSRDGGRSWQRLALPPGVNAAEGITHVDPVTDRLFVTSWSAQVNACGQPVVYTDDEGETWHEAQARPGCSPHGIGDWPKLFTGPFRDGVPGEYPQAVYSCNFVPNILVAASIGCWRSDDGGAHFTFTGFLPVHNIACRAEQVQGGTLATIVHGNGQVLPDGTVVVPVTVCGTPVVARSTDEGRSWDVVETSARSSGLQQWLVGQESLAQNIYQHMFFGSGLAQDERGNLFLAYVRDGVNLAVSTDGGRTWQDRGRISPPEVRGAVDVSLTARGVGEVAVSYFGTNDRGDRVLGAGERYRGWIGHTRDALAARPAFAQAPTSGESDPPQITNTTTGCCANFEYFVEFTAVRFTGPDEIRASFVRQERPHVLPVESPLPELVLGTMRLR